MIYDSACTLCPLHAEAHTVCVPGTGDFQRKLLIVGDAPGRTEDEIGRPFVGRAGSVLDDALAQAGLTRADVLITNVVKCRPPGNRTPKLAEAHICGSKYLAEELHELQPRAILALGSSATQFLTNNTTGIAKRRGVWTRCRRWELNTLVMPTWHPAYILRTPSAMSELVADVTAFGVARYE